MQPPLSVVVLPLVQPVYTTTSQTMVYYIQVQDSSDMDLYLNLNFIPPFSSTQSLQNRQVMVEGRFLHQIKFNISSLSLSDSGEYSLSVQVLSRNPYSEGSSAINKTTLIHITGLLIEIVAIK